MLIQLLKPGYNYVYCIFQAHSDLNRVPYMSVSTTDEDDDDDDDEDREFCVAAAENGEEHLMLQSQRVKV